MPRLNQQGSPRFGEAGVIHQLFLILILLGGIMAGVWLVQHRTNLLPKAQEENYIQIVDKDGNPITETTDPNVYLKITLPPGWQLPLEQKTQGLVKEVRAQESCPVNSQCCYQPLQTCSQNSDCPAKYQWCYSGYCINQEYDVDKDYCKGSTSSTTSSDSNKILDELMIRNGDIGHTPKELGNEAMIVTSNFTQYLNKPFAWRLHGSIKDNEKREVAVQFRGGDKSIIYTSSVKLNIPLPTPSPTVAPITNTPSPEPEYSFIDYIPTYQVDVYIRNTLENPDNIANWASDTIDNYINNRFFKAGINRQVKIDQVITNYEKDPSSCPDEAKVIRRTGNIGVACKFEDNKIRVYIDQNRNIKPYYNSWASPPTATIRLFVPDFPEKDASLFSRLDKQSLAHEMGHIFEIPDYYLEEVKEENNEVVRIGISVHTKDIMSCSFCQDKDYFSTETSTYIANQARPVRDWPLNWHTLYLPEEKVIKVTGDKGLPLKNVEIEGFTQAFISGKSIIPDVLSFQGTTNSYGELYLGSSDFLFKYGRGNSIFLRLTSEGETRYAAITKSQLYAKYFQGDKYSTTLTLRFNFLTEYRPGTHQVLRFFDQPALTAPDLSPLEKELLDEHAKMHLMEDDLISQ